MNRDKFVYRSSLSQKSPFGLGDVHDPIPGLQQIVRTAIIVSPVKQNLEASIMDPSTYVFPRPLAFATQYFDSEVYWSVDDFHARSSRAYLPDQREWGESIRASNGVFCLINEGILPSLRDLRLLNATATSDPAFAASVHNRVDEVARRFLPKHPVIFNDVSMLRERGEIRKRVVRIIQKFYKDDFDAFAEYLKRGTAPQQCLYNSVFSKGCGSVVDTIAVEVFRWLRDPENTPFDDYADGHFMSIVEPVYSREIVFNKDRAYVIGSSTVEEARGWIRIVLSSRPLPPTSRRVLETLLEKNFVDPAKMAESPEGSAETMA